MGFPDPPAYREWEYNDQHSDAWTVEAIMRLKRVRREIAAAGWILLFSIGIGGSRLCTAQVCDPPGPPPRFACQWSMDTCEWFCPICDPFGSPPRTSCVWDGSACNWRCDGYTGVDVTVRTLHAPTHNGTVYVKLSSLCTATGSIAACGGQFDVHPGMSIPQKCQAIASAIEGSCAAAGYAVTVNECSLGALLTASNVDCPGTAFALGISNSPDTFDQAWQSHLPDGEVENTTGRSASCTPLPGPVTGLRLDKTGGGQDIRLRWNDAADADDYLVLEDGAPNGAVSTVIGTAQSGAQGLTISMTPGSEVYLVAGHNSACGVGPKR